MGQDIAYEAHLDTKVLITAARNDAAEAEAIVAMDRACFTQSTINVSAEQERPWSHVWVARWAGDEGPAAEPRAFMLVWVVADELHVLSLATAPAFQRRGLARALLHHCVEFARTRKVRMILLEVRRSNIAAIRLYRTFGFSAMGVRPRYYADNFEDAIEMALVLDLATGNIIPGDDQIRL